MNERRIFSSKVVEEDGQIAVLFSEELLSHLDLKHNDLLVWFIDDDGYISIEKHRKDD
jgi:hypothetical protein